VSTTTPGDLYPFPRTPAKRCGEGQPFGLTHPRRGCPGLPLASRPRCGAPPRWASGVARRLALLTSPSGLRFLARTCGPGLDPSFGRGGGSHESDGGPSLSDRRLEGGSLSPRFEWHQELLGLGPRSVTRTGGL
jgi:hypothetical protein